jgi:hypothetical protein
VRFFELRTYRASPGRMEALLERFRVHTVKLFAKHGITNVGYWVAVNGEHADRTLVYLLAYPSAEARDAMWTAFKDDPEWQTAYLSSQSDGVKLAEFVESRQLTPTDFSPMT